MHGAGIRPRFEGPVILNSDFDVARAQAALDPEVVDAVSFGRPFISHPDFPRRVAEGLPRLRASGPLGGLLARQSHARAREAGMTELARAHSGLPDDLLNFHFDSVACAVAIGWPGAV